MKTLLKAMDEAEKLSNGLKNRWPFWYINFDVFLVTLAYYQLLMIIVKLWDISQWRQKNLAYLINMFI